MIYFMVPDTNRPVGGVRHVYRIVDVLNELGFPAAVSHAVSGFRCTWFDNNTRIVAGHRLLLDSGDLLVVPEVNRVRCQSRTANASVVVLNQNHFNTLGGAGLEDSLAGAYPGWPNAVAVLMTSQACRRLVSSVLREPLPVHIARYVIDSELFVPKSNEKMIAFMPRKRRNDVEAVIQLLHRTPGLRDWRLQPIEEMSESEVAEVLGDAAIFLSFSEREGFGLPPAEAMAAGCYVIGFAGDGGTEYMDPAWCSPINEPDLLGFAREVGRVATAWAAGDERIQEATRRARSVICSRYCLDGLREDLEAAFGALTASDSPALQTAPVEVTHVSWLTPMEKVRRCIRRVVPPKLAQALARSARERR